jgi:selenocysteine lyase/cysteine desulfurase
MLDHRVKLISLNHIPTHSGLVNPVAEIGRVAREWGIPFMLDACQSVGQGPLDVTEIGCDILAAAGRKYLRGPRGTGFLYVSRRLLDKLEPPFLDSYSATWTDVDSYTIRDDARRFECWEANYAAKIGLGVAVDYALDWGLAAVQRRLAELTAGLRDRLSRMKRVVVQDPGTQKCAIVTFTVADRDAQSIFTSLRAKGINASVALARYALLDMKERGLPEVLRVSVHYYNTEVELDRFCTELEALIG